MQLKVHIDRKKNLQSILLKVNNDKNICLIDIMKLNKRLKHFINSSTLNRQLILTLDKKYRFQNEFIGDDVTKKTNGEFIKKVKKTFLRSHQLIVYITENQKFSTDSYTRYEKLIKKMIKESPADFICIGERAEKFCQEHGYNVLKSFTNDKNDHSIAPKLAKMVKIMYQEFNYEKVNFVLNSNKNFNNYFTILPIKHFDVDKLLSKDEKSILDNEDYDRFLNYKIYPGIDTYINSQINIYIVNTIQSLLIESSFYEAKTRLVNYNQTTKNLDDLLLKLNKKIIKIKRENEIEEIVLLTKSADNFSLDSPLKGKANG
ncbi:MSC_0622 family F1-like ATPase gamma subunit [Ureaplasma canigenitalium]|uniref:MSC_0622 family F1-like ATPase gamma subunit n=1 Tax=Ureaplasma canigenitalium TaxID=42092 RepID=UPI0004E228BD|nr:F0F1 ATP synthase subunit gamma [Ureaplasma canigenitalium]